MDSTASSNTTNNDFSNITSNINQNISETNSNKNYESYFNTTFSNSNTEGFIYEFISKIYFSTPHIIIFLIAFYFITRIYLAARERFEEINLFNTDNMSDEEKKLFYFTKRLTFINEKHIKMCEVLANKASNELYDTNYKYAPAIKKSKSKSVKLNVSFDESNNIVYD